MTMPALRTRLAAIGVAAALAVGLAACAPGTEPDPAEPRELRWAIDGANLADGHMDPHSSQLDVSAYVMRNVLDSLVFLDRDGTLRPWLAKNWVVSEDGLEYLFELREDVTFSDGANFDAEAVKANIEHVIDPDTASAQASDMLGGDAFARVEVRGAHSVALVLNRPFPPLLGNLSTAFLGMYSPTALAEQAVSLKAGGPGITVGSGPYVLSSYVPNQELLFTPNADYAWAPEGAARQGAPVEALRVLIIPEQSAVVGAFNSGTIDVASRLTPEAASQLGDAEISTIEAPGMPYSLFLNEQHGVFADARVREAFAIGFDLDAAVTGVFGGQYTRAWSILSPSTAVGYDASLEGSWPFDAARAEQLLDEAGWTERDAEGYRVKDGQRLRAEWYSWTPSSDEHQALGNLIIGDLKRIGFELERFTVEPAEYNEHYGAGTFDVTDWSFASLDADILRNHLHRDGFQNASYVRDAELDALLELGATSPDSEARAEAYRAVQQWNAQHHAIVPIYSAAFITAAADGVEGLAFDSYGWPLFAGASVTDD